MKNMENETKVAVGGGCCFITLAFLIIFILMPIGCVSTYFGKLFNRVANPDQVVENYEWFIQQYEDIKRMDEQIKLAEEALTRFEKAAGERKNWTFQDRDEDARLCSIVIGLQQARTTLVNDYNAKAKMMTRNVFKERNLPDHVQ